MKVVGVFEFGGPEKLRVAYCRIRTPGPVRCGFECAQRQSIRQTR